MENEPIFLDTSFLVSYFNERDENHQKSVLLMEKIMGDAYGVFHISDYIFNECVTVLLARIKNLQTVVAYGEDLKEGSRLITVEKLDFDEAWNFFKHQKDTFLSFTDCLTAVLMKKYRIKYLATFDKEFSKLKEIFPVT